MVVQFSSLEPLDICHVGFVKDVVVAEGPSSEPERLPAGEAHVQEFGCCFALSSMPLVALC